MIFAGWARRCAIGVLFCLGLSGCLPGADSQLDEKKEPHYIAGENLVEQRDYKGAIEEFEKSLEVNPRSASAHFDLAWLYEQQMQDPAAAIYHYDRYLKFSSNPDKGELARQHVNLCKLELAKTVAATGTLASPAQREIDRLEVQSRDLQAQIVTLKDQLSQAKSNAATIVSQKKLAANPPSRTIEETSHRESQRVPAQPSTTTSPTRTSAKTYTIKPGETVAAVARRYGVSISALEAANPNVRPSHLLVGQMLNIPAP